MSATSAVIQSVGSHTTRTWNSSPGRIAGRSSNRARPPLVCEACHSPSIVTWQPRPTALTASANPSPTLATSASAVGTDMVAPYRSGAGQSLDPLKAVHAAACRSTRRHVTASTTETAVDSPVAIPAAMVTVCQSIFMAPECAA